MLLHLRWFPPRSTGGSTFRFAFFLFRDYSTLLFLRFLLFLLFLLFLFPFLFNYVALTDHQLLRPSLFSLLLHFPPSASSLLSSSLPSRSLCFRCCSFSLLFSTGHPRDTKSSYYALPISRRG